MIKINEICVHDAMLPISDLVSHKINEQIYGDIKSDREYLDQLKRIIESQGLNHAVECYEGTTKLVKGHHRTIILSEAGNTEVPVKYIPRPKSRVEETDIILGDNLRKRLTIIEKHKGVKNAIKIYIEEKKDISDSKKQEYCAMLQLGWDSFKKLEELLREGRQDLYDRIDADEDSLSLKRAYQMMHEDLKNKGTRLACTPALFDFVKTRHITNTLFSVGETMRDVLGVPTRITGVDYEFLPGIQENVLSGLMHEVFSHTIAQVLSEDGNVECVATKGQKVNDLQMVGHNWSPETKTSIFDGNTKLLKGWISHSQKSGYFFLLSHNDDYTRFAVIYCFIPFKAWERAGQNWKLKLSAVAELENKKVFCGQIKKDKANEYHLYLDEPKIGE